MDNVNRRFKTRAEREEEEKKKRTAGGVMLPTYEELTAIEEKAKEDAAAAVSSEKGLDFFQKPSNWDDGYQFGDVTKTALGTIGDVGVNVVKGAVRLGEGVGDAAQFGAAAVADLFGADDKAEAIRRNAQRDKVTEAFSSVDEKLNKYSVLGRTSDAAAESLGQIGGVLLTGGIAGGLGAGAVGATAATTGLMGLSSFGSGASEAYEAGAEEGEAEAYGAIAGAADALSEMIFGGLGKGFKALGLSKGITSADDMLVKAVTSKIRNTLVKNTVQMGIKAGAEGLEEVLAGTMQAAGKKATYMSERDFADILADENLLEQFVVGSLASGITQVPSFVSANRAGVDLVSDGGAEGAQGKFADLRDKYADFSKIERTGLTSGAKDDDIRMAGELSSALGKKIRFFREEAKNGTINNGEYHEDTDEIWINARSKNVKAQIVAHELTHSIEKHDGYRQLVNMAMEKLEAEQKAKGKTIDDLYRQKEMLYADGNVRLGSYEEITSELVAEFVEKRLLTDEKSIKSLVSENRTLGQRIREWFDSLLAKIGNASAKERDYIRQMRDVYARALGERVSDTKAEHVSHSLQRIDDTYYVKADRVIFTNEDGTPASERDVFNALVGETIETPEGEIEIVKRLPGKSIYDELYKRRPRYDGVQDIKALNSEINYNMEELLENTSVKEPDILDQEGKHSKQGIVSFDTRTVKFYDGDRAYDVEIDIAKLQNGKKIGYAKKYIGYDAELTKKIQEAEAMGEKSQLNQQPVSNNSISQNGGNVNRKFSVSKVVEETKDLIAVHNLNSDKLMKSIALGGMPMPSIAIAKAEVGHENFGDISLVFDKSTIDPQASAENKVYSGDAWTPTYPPVEYKVNDAVERRVRDKYYDLAERIGYDEARSMYRYAENLDDSLNRAGGEEAMLQRLYDDTGMMQIYLQDVGRGKVEPIMREVTVKVPEAQAFVSEYLIEVLGADLVSGIKAPDGVIPKEHRRAYMDAHGTEIRDAYKQMRMELYGDSEVDAAAKAADAKAFELLSLVNNAYKYMQNGGTTVSTTTDTTATNEAIRAAASDGYREWVDGLFRGVQDKAGIRNKQDTFDKAGNRRSWDATHYEETLENVVRAMKESGEKGISGSGGGDIFGASTQEFSSIEDIKKTAGRIQNLTNGEYQDIKRGFRERFSELAGSLPKNKDSFFAMNDAANMLVEAVVKYKTKKGIDGYLRRESQGWANYSPDVTEELISLVNDIRAMPTQYFEAKPQRAVSFDEVAAFVIPRNADIKVKQELLNRGYSIAEYDPDVPGDRAKVLNGMDKYKFSISKSDDPDNKRVMPKRSAAGTKARARQEQQARMRFEQKVMNRGFDNLSPAEQEHYRDEIVGQYRRKYDDYKKKRDALIASGYRFAGVDDYVEKVVGSVEDAAIDANTFLIHYQEGVFGDPTRDDVQDFALDYLQMVGMHRPDTGETYEQDMWDDVPMPGDEDVPPQRRSAKAEYGEPETVEVAGEEDPKLTRKVLHKNIIDRIKERFSERGFDFDKVLAKAKDLSTFATVDNTPQRVMEKSLGYKEGRELSDLTIDQAARNETEGIRWLNGFTDRKDGVLAKLSKKYNIKPGSKESAAAQMYAEGFYVSNKNEIVEYGDRELAADFPDAKVRENIKGLARDPIIRQIYDETLDAINASRKRNAFPEIQKLDNYYLHFRAMDDTFSRLGIPFNPNDIRAKDLPTDLNGVTADLKPGQPYFASAKHRLGKRTSFDLLGGMEKYLTSAKNQIYHIDDIQTLRALRNYVADMYGQAEGLSNLDDLSDEEVEARIKDVYGSHLSTFAKFLNEEANVLAGKTSLIDRGLEGVIGRRGITFLNDVNRQVGANMVGYNISPSLTNFLAPVQAFAKMNKAAFIKGFAQTVENRMKSITGNGDDFAKKSDVIVRRKGADRFHRTAWQKMSDPGYLLMGMVDDISTEIIARAKYNELTAKGMDAETANRETDKWVSRLMGDRSLGQMPQIFNSKMLGLVTKFQLEVRNQLDSQFYDTIKEAQVQYEEIGDKAKRNAKTAAKVAAIFAELALAQHVFGSVFESIAGYNPAFDIIEVIATVLGLDDEEESEDTVLDNIEQGVLALIEDLPYSSVIMDGGRIPISSALPIGEIIKGQDEYGNDINRLKTVAEAVPYYALPGGYGQIKKTAKGLSMFSGEKAVTGSYTDSGNLRFPVEATPGNIAQAAVFGQWANENARDYFDNERKPANERQAMGYAESGLEWKEFQRYREQISKLDRDADKLELIKSLDIDQTAKEALYRYLVASAKKDGEGNIIGSSEDERLAALYATGLGFSDYADAKLKQAELNADEGLTANQRATRFYAWAASEGYTDEQTDAITEQFKFSSGFKVEPTQYKKLIGGGVSPDNAVLVTDALSGASRAIDKINAIWSTGLTGKQLDNAVKAVVTEGWYERYRKVIDANVPLDVLTWVLDNADANGNDSIDNEERILILSQLVLSQKELSALWEATGGSEKSNPYKGTTGVSMPKIDLPKIELPEIELPKIGG